MFEQGKFIKESEEFLSHVRSDQVAPWVDDTEWGKIQKEIPSTCQRFWWRVVFVAAARAKSSREAPGLKNDSTFEEKEKSTERKVLGVCLAESIAANVYRMMNVCFLPFQDFSSSSNLLNVLALFFLLLPFGCFCGQGEIVGKCKHLSFSPISSSQSWFTPVAGRRCVLKESSTP